MTEKYKKSWLRDEVLSEWDVDPAVIEQKQTGRETGTRRFVPIPTMNKIVKHLTDGAEKLFQTRIETITRKDDKYRLVDEDGNQFDHDWLVLTAPPRQTDDLMGDLPESSILEDVEISMLPTWSYVCLLESEIPSEFEAAFVNDQSPIRWVARNGSKPERKNQPSWVVQAEHDWSDRNINKSENWVVEELHESFRKLLGEPSLNVDHEEAHRWRYARAENPSEIGSWQQGGVIVSGDWLNGSRMEGAFLSGQHAAGRILRKLKVESES